LISWTAIGARTTESQTHREMASGLSMPIGYKNSTDGSATIAINAMQAASKPHHFLGINREGHASIVSTTGNPNGHLVLRGGNRGTNYHLEAIQDSAAELNAAGLPDRLMVDCSHGNSNKDYRRQGEVLKAVAAQVDQKLDHIMGVMVESHLVEGNQKLSSDRSSLTYGQSVTDACISIETTAELLGELAASVAKARLT
jgi:3-deoxy-7-phosphoheptulonate synthase